MQYVLIEMTNEVIGVDEYGETKTKTKPVVKFIAESKDTMKAHLSALKQFQKKLSAAGLNETSGELVVAQYDPDAE